MVQIRARMLSSNYAPSPPLTSSLQPKVVRIRTAYGSATQAAKMHMKAKSLAEHPEGLWPFATPEVQPFGVFAAASLFIPLLLRVPDSVENDHASHG